MTPKRSPIVEREYLDRMLDGLVVGGYHLLLGAGASAGVTNPAGEVPMAQGLTELLADEIDATTRPDGLSLQRAFNRAVSVKGEAHIQELLRHRFSRCTPTAWQSKAAEIPWQAIWTLNVDDAIQHAYDTNEDRAQRAKTVNWTEPTVPLGGSGDQVPIVHLHGYVGDLDRRDDPSVVFSFNSILAHFDTPTLVIGKHGSGRITERCRSWLLGRSCSPSSTFSRS